jgi:hypothetical protein
MMGGEIECSSRDQLDPSSEGVTRPKAVPPQRCSLRSCSLGLVPLLAIGATILACSEAAHSSPGWTMVAHVRAGERTGPITLGGRWAFAPNMADGTVTQIDRTSGRVVATIRVSDPQVLRAQGCAPDSVHAYYSGSWGWRACDTPYALAWDGARLWAIDNGQRQLVGVDPGLHRAIGAIDLPGTAWDVAIDGATAWVTGWDDDSLYAVDLGSRRVVNAVRGLDAGPSTLAIVPGAVWVVCARGAGRLDRVDPASGRIVSRYEIEWWSNDVIANAGAVYVRGTYGGDISRMDPVTGARGWSRPGPGFLGRPGIDQMAVSRGGIWLSGTTTTGIDPRTGRIAETIPVASSSVAADGDELWLVRLDGTVAEFRWK